MGYDEKFFHWLWKRRKTRRASRELQEGAVSLRENLYRFSLLAFALAGEWLQIFEAEASGGFIGARLYLPRQMSLSSEPAINGEAFLYRIAHSVALRAAACDLPDAFAKAPERRILDYLAIPVAEEWIRAQLPALAERLPALKAALLSERAPVESLRRPAEFFEALNQHYLGRPLAPEAAQPVEAARSYAWILKASRIASPVLPDGKNWLSELGEAIRGLPYPLSTEGILPLWGRLPLEGEKHALLSNPAKAGAGAPPPQGTEKEKPPTESAKLVDFDEDNEEQMPAQQIIEQVKTLEKFMGGKKTVDASDELEEHSEALEEVDVREVYRSKRQTQSIFRSDAALSPAELELQEDPALPGKTYFYDEWDYRKRAYRKRWCQVTEATIQSLKSSDEVRERIAEVRRKYRRETALIRRWLESLKTQQAWKNRQTEGVDIDLDALVDRYASVRGGHSPSDKLYLSRRKNARDLSLLVLMDASLSTGAWLEGRQVMASSQETLLILEPLFDELDDRIALAGFHSNTRTRCSYLPLKDFQERWDPRSQAKLLSLEPAGYTRIGPALRHSVSKMARHSSSRKAILLVTDGKPSDYDAYEGHYGIEDVRQAIREANQKSISVYSLAIDQRARSYFPRMFGQNHFSVLRHPRELPVKLMKWCLRLLYGR